MRIDWSPLAELIGRHDRFLVTTHVRPDGDALGSEVGMAGLLRARGKDVRVVNVSPTPPRYAFLNHDGPGRLFGHFGHDVAADELSDRQALVILDLSSWSQLGEMAPFVRDFPGPKLVIDHHVSQDDLGATLLKDVTAEATGTLVLRAAEALGVPVSPAMAEGLLTAIAMDTGWFRHPNTRPGTLRDAAALMEAGADINRVYRLLFERGTVGRLRLTGVALERVATDLDGRVAYSSVTREDFTRTGAIPPETEDLIDHLAGLAGVEVALLFIEQIRGGIKLSLRSRGDFDVSALAARFGGGGHRAAAGANLTDPLPDRVAEVLEAIRQTLPPA
jgi:phosphoesterase RecJ-like protein